MNQHAPAFEMHVRAAFEGTPYVITQTPIGFDVTIDVANAQWFGLFNKAGLRSVFTHQVKIGDGWFSITDVERQLRWTAGVPSLGSASLQKGRVIQYSSKKTWAFDQSGSFRPVVDYRFDSEEGRSVIVELGKQLGLLQRMSGYAKVGLVFALIAIVGLVLGGIVVAVMAGMGAL